ncbi:MAG: prepilin-type N-terminal cleavage/methylation domain-containing protein [Gammaproteobacteria bacterium]|nr:prepilin-type N-terminal cleavage/methylation domain-containing protein [Gammaproteobacteria bacterium]
MKGRCHPQAGIRKLVGFTLLEVLIAIALFGITLSLLLGAFRFTSKAWEKGETAAAETTDLQVVHRVFQGMLGRAFPVAIEEDTDSNFAFEGSDSMLKFAAFLPPYPDRAGLYRIQFTIAREGDKHRLTVSRDRFNPDDFQDGAVKKEHTALLLESPRPLEFSYFGILEDDEEPDWHPEWEFGERYPSLVRLSTSDETSEDTGWPSIVIRIQIDMDSACIFPELTGKCRITN